MKRPLIWVALLYTGGILLSGLPVSLPGLFVVVFVLALLFSFWKSPRNLLLCSLVILCGWINTARRTAIVSPDDLRTVSGGEARIATLRGTLLETPRLRSFEIKDRELWTSAARLAVSSVRMSDETWRPACGTVLCSTDKKLPETIFGGQTVEVSGVLQSPRSAVAEGLFNYREYLKQQGIYRQLSSKAVSDWKILSSPAHPPLADRFSAWARTVLAMGMPAEDEIVHLEWALTLGWKAELSDDTMEPFIRAATVHIFAVDGLRIAIVSGMIFFLLRSAGFSRVWCGILAFPFLLCYAAMTGWPASAIRALVMIAIVYGGWALQRPGDLLNSLFGAALVILLWEPRQLFQAGFQLSFVVVLCIILVLPMLKKIGEHFLRPDPLRPESMESRWLKASRQGARYVTDLFITSLAAWAGSIPLVAYYFHILSPVSGFSNLIAVPLCGLVLMCNLGSLMFAAWFPSCAILLNHAGWLFMKIILVTSIWCAQLPKACFNVSMPTLFGIGLYYFILLAVATGWLWEIRGRKIKITALAALIVVWLRERPVNRITLLPLQNAHAVYVSQPGWQPDWLVDCGNDAGVARTAKPFLQAHGVNRLGSFVLTHGEAAFTGGARLVTGNFEPYRLYTSALNFRSPTYRAFIAGLRARSLSPIALESGAKIPPWTVLYPPAQSPLAKASDNSLVLLGDFNGLRVLLISNLGREGQDALRDSSSNLGADIVFSGTTIQDEPLSEPLLDAIHPKIIVIADTPKTISETTRETLRQRLQKFPAEVFYTSDSDAVTLEIRPGRWELRTMNGLKISGIIPKGSPVSP
jgi:competence protein ComEC